MNTCARKASSGVSVQLCTREACKLGWQQPHLHVMAVPDLVPESDPSRQQPSRVLVVEPVPVTPSKKCTQNCTVEASGRRWTKKRVLYCAGWILCCPFFTLCMCLRESHVDDDDLRQDECYPCYS